MPVSRTTRLTALAATLLITSITLTGCSAGSVAESPASGSAGSPTEGTFAKQEGTLVFGATPDQAGSDANNKPLEDYIAKKTGMKVEYYPTSDYTALIAATVAGKVDIMTSGGLQYVQAVNRGAKIEPVAATLTSPDVDDPGYYSEAIVPKGSPIKKLSGAEGKTVCFVDPTSTSGFLFGLYQLRKAGLSVATTGTDASGNPQFKDFTAYFAGAHDKSAQAVASGQCDVGFAEDSVVTPEVRSGDLEVLGKAYVPGGPLSISSTLPSDVKAKLTKVLAGATVDAVKSSGVSMTTGFTEGYFGAQAEDAGYYESIRDLCKSIPSAQCAK